MAKSGEKWQKWGIVAKRGKVVKSGKKCEKVEKVGKSGEKWLTVGKS